MIQNGSKSIGYVKCRSIIEDLVVFEDRFNEFHTIAIKQRNITLEVCLTSNIGNGFKVASYAEHPVRQLEEDGEASDLMTLPPPGIAFLKFLSFQESSCG